MLERFWAKINKDGPESYEGLGKCWLSLHEPNREYPRIAMNGKPTAVHRISWQIHFGKIPFNLQVLHRCDNPRCVNPEHLFLGTQQDNIQDMVNKGRLVLPTRPDNRGERMGRAKLTEESIRYIRMWRQEGFKTREIAKAFGITKSFVSGIVLRRYWSHVI